MERGLQTTADWCAKSLSTNPFISPHKTTLTVMSFIRTAPFTNPTNYHPFTVGKRSRSYSLRTSNNPFVVYSAKSELDSKLNSLEKDRHAVNIRKDGTESFHGKSGSISFRGLTHELVEESKLESSPFKENCGSVVWVLAPVALISSLVLPQFFLSSTIDSIVRDDILSEILISFSSEVMFYIGLSIFLKVTDHVQKPYLQFSSKRWSLITGLKGYLTSAFFIMGLKVIAPFLAVYVTWPILGVPALVAVAPFMAGLLAQFLFELRIDKSGSSSWPLVPLIFEVYRLYQLSKAANFLERLMYGMRDATMTPQVMERSGAMVAMLVTFQILGSVCLWSLMTFLMRLFPSRPVAQKY